MNRNRIHTILIIRNGRHCLYNVYDLIIENSILSFHIGKTFYMFEFTFDAFASVYTNSIIDCTRLTLIEEREDS